MFPKLVNIYLYKNCQHIFIHLLSSGLANCQSHPYKQITLYNNTNMQIDGPLHYT